jgi:hypothetical protein
MAELTSTAPRRVYGDESPLRPAGRRSFSSFLRAGRHIRIMRTLIMGPGLVLVSWEWCHCAGPWAVYPDRAAWGHLTVACGVPGCRSVWYSPCHESRQKCWLQVRIYGRAYASVKVSRFASHLGVASGVAGVPAR